MRSFNAQDAAALRRAAACSRRRSCDGSQGWMAGHLGGACWGAASDLRGGALFVEASACRRQAGMARRGAHGQEPRSGRRS